MKKIFLLLFILLTISALDALAQDGPRFRKFGQRSQPLGDKPNPATLFGVSYGIDMPIGDMSDRFGMNSNLSVGVFQKTAKNWLFGVEGYFIFGKNVKQDSLLINLLNSSGQITGIDGSPSIIELSERGYMAMLTVGKIIPLSKSNPHSGLKVTLSGGFMEHRIKIADVREATPQVRGEYLKGYDRLANGFMLKEFFGYVYFDKRKLINFYVGVEAIQGFTQGRRDLNFDTQRAGTEKRLDLLLGLKGGWILPIYKRMEEKYFTN